MAKTNSKSNYRRTLELSFLVVLILMQLTFFGFRFLSLEAQTIQTETNQPEWINIPPTKPPEAPPQPKPPTVAVPSENPEIPDDATIPPDVKIDLSKIPPPPEPKIVEIYEFHQIEEKPAPIGGWGAIHRNLVYPEMARKLNIEGRTVVEIIISKSGQVISAKVLQTSGSQLLDNAAIAALQKTKWRPACQRDLPVNVRVSVPVDFRLR